MVESVVESVVRMDIVLVRTCRPLICSLTSPSFRVTIQSTVTTSGRLFSAWKGSLPTRQASQQSFLWLPYFFCRLNVNAVFRCHFDIDHPRISYTPFNTLARTKSMVSTIRRFIESSAKPNQTTPSAVFLPIVLPTPLYNLPSPPTTVSKPRILTKGIYEGVIAAPSVTAPTKDYTRPQNDKRQPQDTLVRTTILFRCLFDVLQSRPRALFVDGW